MWGTALALFSAAVFLCHPLQSQAVSYITQRFASLATLFYLASILFYIKARVGFKNGEACTRTTRTRAWALYILCFLSAAAAMKTKEISFTLPFAITLFDFVFFRGGMKDRRLCLPLYIMLLIIPLTLLYHEADATFWVEAGLRRAKLDEALMMPRGKYLLTQFAVVATYIRLFFIPVGQRFEYDFPIAGSFFEPRTFLCFLFLFSIAALGLFLLMRSRSKGGAYGTIAGFGILWFFITVSVESSVIPIKDVIFEHRAYLPSFGAVMAAGSFLFYIARRFYRGKASGVPSATAVTSVLLIVTCIPLSALLYKRNLLWSDELAFADYEIMMSPGEARKAEVYYTRGMILLERGRLEDSIPDSVMAIKIKPTHFMAYNNLGIAHANLGRYAESVEDFSRAIEISPRYFKTYLNRSLSYITHKRYHEALSDLETALLIRPYETREFLASEYVEELRRVCREEEFTSCLKLGL